MRVQYDRQNTIVDARSTLAAGVIGFQMLQDSLSSTNWFSPVYRHLLQTDLVWVEAGKRSMNDEPTAVVAETGSPGEDGFLRVVIDQRAKTVTFLDCHMPGRFPLACEHEYTCGLHEIRGYQWLTIKNQGRALEVLTSVGRARLPCSMAGLSLVLAEIEDAVARTGNRLAWYESPAGQGLIMLVVVSIAVSGVVFLSDEMTVPKWVFGILLAVPTLAICGLVIWARWRGRRL